jgi:hypothetical protein
MRRAENERLDNIVVFSFAPDRFLTRTGVGPPHVIKPAVFIKNARSPPFLGGSM